ncbi:MAG: pentapeptide repeat-containing protein [Lachnospiraceae bacterium]
MATAANIAITAIIRVILTGFGIGFLTFLLFPELFSLELYWSISTVWFCSGLVSVFTSAASSLTLSALTGSSLTGSSLTGASLTGSSLTCSSLTGSSGCFVSNEAVIEVPSSLLMFKEEKPISSIVSGRFSTTGAFVVSVSLSPAVSSSSSYGTSGAISIITSSCEPIFLVFSFQ